MDLRLSCASGGELQLLVENPYCGREFVRGGIFSPREFHRRMPGYSVTPLVEAKGLAERLGARSALVKDESSRLDLPSFKLLGASWAIYRILAQRLGDRLTRWTAFPELVERVAAVKPLTLVTATAGNHGRAVAHMARLLGLEAEVYVPIGTADVRIEAIATEGASVHVVKGTADDAIAACAEAAAERKVVVSDSAWDGYEVVGRWVMEGYSTMFEEVAEQVASEQRGTSGPWVPDVAFLQIGVGAFAGSAVRSLRRHAGWEGLTVVGVEPERAACVAESIIAGRRTTIDASSSTIMVGLNCGTPSLAGWPELLNELDAFLTVGDHRAREAMRLLAADGITSGESGAGGVAGALEAAEQHGLGGIESPPKLGLAGLNVLFVSTEGATNPGNYQRIIGGDAPNSGEM